MARPYRIIALNYRRGEIIAKRERYLTTKPLSQTMVSPRFTGGILSLRLGRDAFIAEAELQVSERVTGFKEVRGNTDDDHLYGPTSPYSRRELTRFFPTTGICWYFADRRWVSERVGTLILEAYASAFGVQSRDLGAGAFHANASPLGNARCQGMCVFDATHGSLRLTQRLAESFWEVLSAAIALAVAQRDRNVVSLLESMRDAVVTLPDATALDRVGAVVVARSSPQDDWAILIAGGSVGMLESLSGPQEVSIRGWRYTPLGLLYDLEPARDSLTWQVAARDVRPIYGQSQLIRVNLVTGEVGSAE